jgi:GT2 family glycosyltransferase
MKKQRITVCVPILNQLTESKVLLGLLRYNTSDNAEFMIIDNGSTDDIEGFFYKYLRPKRLRIIRNEENIGLVKTYQQAYENCETEILAITHNDVAIYEPMWDTRIVKYFESIPNLGMVGFFGAQGCGPIGERLQETPKPGMMAGMSNMLEAEIHGFRLEQEWRSAAIFDGLMMICNMEMLRKGKGFDQRYIYHHYYDRAVSLQSLALGYKNIVVNVPCHHLSGLTANRPEYQAWIDKKTNHENYTGDQWTHDTNMQIFKQIWGPVLPLYVRDDFSFKGGFDGMTDSNGYLSRWDYKGDKIVGYDWLKTKVNL